LAGADLTRADLTRANLTDADLAGADLTRAYLTGAQNYDPAAAPGAPAQPYERRVRTRLERAADYRTRHPEVPVVESLDAKILEAVTSGGGRLEMGSWHTCETTHCRAGWAVHLAGAAGYALERLHNTGVAGRMIYRASTGRVPYFFASNDLALADIRRYAAEDQAHAT
jgi:hypothetical protein